MTKGTAFHQTGIMESHKLWIMGYSRNAKPLCPLMKLRVELLELLGKRLLQLLCLGRSELFLHDVTRAYFRAGFLNRLPVSGCQRYRDALYPCGDLSHFTPEQILH